MSARVTGALKPCNSHKTRDAEIRAAEAPMLMPSRASFEWSVACPVCPIQTPWFDTEAEAVAAWDTRHREQATAELVEALREARTFIDTEPALNDHPCPGVNCGRCKRRHAAFTKVNAALSRHTEPTDAARQSAIAELCEGLDAEFANAAQKLEVPEGHPDKAQRDFAIGVLWALQEAIHTRALLSKHSPDAPGDAGTRAIEPSDGDEV